MIYAAIKGTKYIASAAGEIYRRTRTRYRPVKPFDNGIGYRRISLYTEANGTKKTLLVHRLVWEAFNGPIPEGLEINHKNRNRSDNRLENLELLTHLENMRYSARLRREERAKNELQ